MYTSDLTTLSRSASSKGFQKDRQNHEAIARRQKKRRDIEDLQDFMDLMAKIAPDYYEVNNG